MEPAQLRKEIDARIASGDAAAASRLLEDLWRHDGGTAAASFVVSRFEKLRTGLPLQPFRFAVLRSFTVEPLLPMLRAACFVAGIDLAVHVGDFNAYAREMLDAESSLYSFGADAVVLAVQTRDVAPDLWRDFADLQEAGRGAITARVINDFRSWVRAFRAHSSAHLIIHTLEEPAVARHGILDAMVEDGQIATIRKINEELRQLAADEGGVYVLDYDALVARHGRDAWHDERKWLVMRMPFAASSLDAMVKEWMRFIHPLAGRVCKAIAVDLDNTLWGGVVGEDGPGGIHLGAEHPGAAYSELQRALLDLYRRGILLCVASKNNADDVAGVLREHPEMLLRAEHFAAMRINWNDKAESLRELSAELNIGTDALAFLDDNPVEREQVRAALPEVTVIELPRDAAQFARVLRDSPVFERLSLSAEDRERGRLYAAQRERARVGEAAATREDFYRSLEQEAEVSVLTPLSLPRIAQLTQKTNQFNLTTRRYTEQQLAAMRENANQRVYALRVRDRFGDNGIVGAAIVNKSGDDDKEWEIDTFLLSCRVIGRTVETALLAHIVAEARSGGAGRLAGWFLPTKKNAPASEFYHRHGFSPVAESAEGTRWTLDLSASNVECPDWIRLVVLNGEMN